MKEKIAFEIEQALQRAFKKGELPSSDFPYPEIEVPKIASHGDFSTNIAMVIASSQRISPQNIARIIIENIKDSDGLFSRVEVAGPGFINFFINDSWWFSVLREIHEQGPAFGISKQKKRKKVQVEFVSANPTGPLHVGHGRCAALGDSLAAILDATGYEVQKEYYINDSGRQIHTLGLSVLLRYKELFGKKIDFPDDCYQGDYIIVLAKKLAQREKRRYLEMPEEDAIPLCAKFAAREILSGIREDLELFGVSFDQWFHEQGLFDSGAVDETISELRSRKLVYEHDGALWFRSTAFGDEKDRVIVRSNGETTYFASDIAYHRHKLKRNFDQIINIWGADHHGYVSRIQASIEALGYPRDRVRVVLVQLVNLLRNGRPAAMSTRAGEFITLREIIDEVGKDAARFLLLMHHSDSPLDFDLEAAKQQNNNNPVYYVQYVHARISSIMRKAKEQGISTEDLVETPHDDVLTQPEEMQLIKCMARYPDMLAQSALLMEPHRVPFYLMELASLFHAYYNKHRVLTGDAELSRARLYLVSAVRKIIRNGLQLIGVSAPEVM